MTALLLTAAALLGANAPPASPEENYDPFLRAVPVAKYSFEVEDDRDYDGRPDEWSRRIGPGFPNYVRAEIDRSRAEDGKQSLEIRANGGSAAYYSPPIPINPTHSWLLEGSVRTQQLHHDAAIVSLSFLNARRQRVARVLTPAVTGTHTGWVNVRIGPVDAASDVRFVVIGCHLASGKMKDIGGSAWFDNLRLLKLPQLHLESNYQTHFRQRFADIVIRAEVGGLDEESRYSLNLEMVSSSGATVARTVRDLTGDRPALAEMPPTAAVPTARAEASGTPREQVVWTLPPQDYGHYEIHAVLHRDGAVILRSQTSCAVLDLIDAAGRGSFGWSVESGARRMDLRELADVAAQSGINWVKFPVWSSVFDEDKELPGRIAEMFDLLSYRGISSVGMLNDPPPELRAKFARDWAGISEVFTMPASFWSPALEPVLARYSTHVQHWQLGGDTDGSFIGLKNIQTHLKGAKRFCDQIGRDSRIGVDWNWETPWPPGSHPPQSFLVLDGSAPMTPEELQKKLEATRNAGMLRWVSLRPMASAAADHETRAADLVKRMTAARIGGADAILAADVFAPDTGLLSHDGAPTRLYLPWRTPAIALQGTTYIGSFSLPNRSTNHVFARKDEVVVVAWNDESVEESMYFGEEVVTADVWGHYTPIPLDPKTGMQTVRVGQTPILIRGCSEPVARWRLEARFEKGRIPSAYGEHRDAIVGINTFPQGVNGKVSVTFPPEWEVEPRSWTLQVGAGEPFRLPMTLTLPPNAGLGDAGVQIHFDVVADRPYKFRAFHKYQVGLGDIHLAVTDRKRDDGRLEIEQLIINQTNPPETLNFRCSLFVPHHKRQFVFVTKLKQGQDRKFYYLPDAESLRGQELWIRAEQVDGRRVLNHKWKVGKDWDKVPEDEN